MTQGEVDAEGFLPFCVASVTALCTRFRDSGAWLLGVDGFMGSGKSPLASMFEYAIGQEAIRLDLLLDPPALADQRTYMQRVNAARLDERLFPQTAGEVRIVEGVQLQKLLEPRVARSKVFLVYVAAAWSPDAGSISWPDGRRIETTVLSPIPIHADIETYHREFRPHETSDAVVLRDADKHQLGDTLTSPDGQEFSISHEVVNAAGVQNWRARTSAYVAQPNCAASIEPLGLIRPPILGANTRALTPERLANALRAMRDNTPLPPVQAFREPGSPIATLLDGAHRYFASVAVGFTHIPCNLVTREEAEVRYAYAG